MINAEAVNAVATHVQRPIELDSVVVVPPNWTAKHKNELAKADPAFAKPKCAALQVATLGALRDYLKANRDGLDLSKIIVHIETPNRVTVGSILREPARDREIYLTATADDMTKDFVGHYHEPSDFNIGLMVRFLPPIGPNDVTNQRDALITVVSSVSVEQAAEATDTGMTQTVTSRGGVTLKARQDLPNPVTLAPFRTFRDILQPSSPFVLRAQADPGSLPELCLFEAEGGTWKLLAIQRIHDWLKNELKDLQTEVAILA